MSGIRVKQPVDANGKAINRAMGVPMVQDAIVLSSATYFMNIFDLSSSTYASRVFHGMSISNPSASTTVEVAFGELGASTKQIVCGASEYFSLDSMLFGPGCVDETTGAHSLYVRAKLGTAQGTQSSGTIGYAAANPTNGMLVNFNGKIYEFSNDASQATTSDYIVAIGASGDLTWTAFVAAVNANELAARASINTGTDIVTLTSIAAGAAADLALSDGSVPTGATFSGATLTGHAGGVTPIFHIW